MALLLPVIARAQGRTVTGQVVDSVTGETIERVTVSMGGMRAETATDGTFRLSGAGDVIMLRRIGYAPRAVRVSDSAAMRIVLSPAAYDLDTISVRAEMIRRSPNLAGFYERRRLGTGTYFTRDEIWKRNPIYITELVRTVPNITCSSRGCQSKRPSGWSRFCTMQVIVDGVPTERDLADIPPAWVVGIEVYRGISTTPIQYGGTGRGDRGAQCGTIVVWTGADQE